MHRWTCSYMLISYHNTFYSLLSCFWIQYHCLEWRSFRFISLFGPMASCIYRLDWPFLAIQKVWYCSKWGEIFFLSASNMYCCCCCCCGCAILKTTVGTQLFAMDWMALSNIFAQLTVLRLQRFRQSFL